MGGTVRIYQSTDASAPTLSGTAGDLINLLDKCLVDGYGAMSAAGWSKPYANSGNKGCWRMATTNNTGYYLAIDDSAPGVNGAREARATGYRTMSAVATGTYPWPIYAQMARGTAGGAGNVIFRKSNTANATTRPWVVVADDSCFYLFIDAGDVSSPPCHYGYFFGDIFSFKTGDTHRCLLIGGNAEDSTYFWATNCCFGSMPNNAFMLHKQCMGHYMASRHDGMGSSLWVGKHWFVPHHSASAYGLDNTADFNWPTPLLYTWAQNTNHYGMGACKSLPGAYITPNPCDTNLHVSPVWIHHNGMIRGYMKGLWVPLHDRALSHLDSVSGTGNLSGKTFTNIGIAGPGWNSTIGPDYSQGNAFLETSNTWS